MRTRTRLSIVIVVVVGGGILMYSASSPMGAGATTPSAFPTRAEAPALLDATHHHPEWIRVATPGRTLLAAVTYPDRADAAPVVVIAAAGEKLTPWLRAVADQVTAEGFIAVVPDALSSDGTGIAAVTEQVAEHPAANGRTAMMTLTSALQIDTGKAIARFALSDAGWPAAIRFLHTATGNDPSKVVAVPPHSGHAPALAQGPPAPAGRGAGPRGYPGGKLDNLPAGIFTAKTTVARSPIKYEWVDIPTPGVYNGRMHTRITYPDGGARVGVVVVMQHGPGADEWMHAVGDQLSRQGFIALAPDLHTGMGPNGGNYESFVGPADAFEANARLNPAMTLAAYKAVREYGMKLARANGKSAALGFCMGGGNAWALAVDVPALNAAVVYYGGSPRDESAMARITAPVIGFYGEDDARVTATVEPTVAIMKKLGKVFEPHVYPHATHGFLEFQDLAGNPEATLDSWTRTIAFLQQHLR